MDALENPVIGPDAAALVGKGVAVVIATRDGELRPDVTRAWGPEIADDLEHMTLCVAVGGRPRTLANLAEGAELAATFCLPTSYRALQMKGVVVDVRDPAPEQMRLAEQHLDRFAAEAVQVGIPQRVVHRFLDGGPFVSVTFAVRELYDQTPGPSAGAQW